MTPEVILNPEAFQGVIDQLRIEATNDLVNNLKVQGGQGRADILNFIPEGYEAKQLGPGAWDVVKKGEGATGTAPTGTVKMISPKGVVRDIDPATAKILEGMNWKPYESGR